MEAEGPVETNWSISAPRNPLIRFTANRFAYTAARWVLKTPFLHLTQEEWRSLTQQLPPGPPCPCFGEPQGACPRSAKRSFPDLIISCSSSFNLYANLEKTSVFLCFTTNFLPLCEVLMNLYLSLDFKTFDSCLLLRTLEPKANLAQLVIKRPSLSVFWSYISTAANSSALTESSALTQHPSSGMMVMYILSSEVSWWQIPVTMMLKFSTVKKKRNPVSHRSATNCYCATELSLLWRVYLQPPRNLSHHHRPTTIILIAKAEDSIRKD